MSFAHKSGVTHLEKSVSDEIFKSSGLKLFVEQEFQRFGIPICRNNRVKRFNENAFFTCVLFLSNFIIIDLLCCEYFGKY